jgi:hypothetical protein
MPSVAPRPCLAPSLALCVLSACSFDAAGNGFPAGASVGDGSSSSADTDAGGDEPAPASGPDQGPDPSPDPTAGPMTDGGGGPHASAGDDAPGTETGAPEDGAESDGGSAVSQSASDGDATTGDADAPTCPASMFELVWVDDGELVAPMQLVAADANDSPNVAASSVAESGEVTVALEFACPGEYTLWGLVWDYDPGAWGEPDPDSFYFDVGGSESTWRYGCQTDGTASGLSWQRLAALAAQPCDASYIVLQVYEAGTVELTLRNREAGSGSQVAGIAAIVVSDDPDADPSTLYDPG